MEEKLKTTKKKVARKSKKSSKATKKQTKKDVKKVEINIKNFPSPFKDTAFVKYWSSFLEDIEDRENFHSGHLKNLEILCQLYTEYDLLTDILKREGFAYTAHGRYGSQVKTRPESTERNKILAEIRQYARLLGIILSVGQGTPEDDEKGEWD